MRILFAIFFILLAAVLIVILPYPDSNNINSANSEKKELILALWESELDDPLSFSGSFDFQASLKNSDKLSESDIAVVEKAVKEISFETLEKESFATWYALKLESEKKVYRALLDFSGDTSPVKQEEPLPVGNHIYSLSVPVVTGNSDTVLNKFSNKTFNTLSLVKTISPKYGYRFGYISKKLQKYYSLTTNAPPYGEEKC